MYLFQVSASTLLLGTPGFRRLQAYLPQHRCVWSLGEAGLDEARGAVTNTKVIKRVLIFPGYHDLSRDAKSQALVENMMRVTSSLGPVYVTPAAAAAAPPPPPSPVTPPIPTTTTAGGDGGTTGTSASSGTSALTAAGAAAGQYASLGLR